MITRDISGLFVVPAFDLKTFKSCDTAPAYSCGYNPTVCGAAGSTGGTGFNGRIIDRLGLPAHYTSVLALANGICAFECSSTGQVGTYRQVYMSLGVGIDHNCSTGAGWSALSTDKWVIQPAFLQSTASSWNQYLTTATDTGSALCTSTGMALAEARGVFDLSQAKRYIRMVVIPEIHSSGCALQMPVTGQFIFGSPAEAPPPDIPVDVRIVVTSACSTST